MHDSGWYRPVVHNESVKSDCTNPCVRSTSGAGWVLVDLSGRTRRDQEIRGTDPAPVKMYDGKARDAI